MGIKDWENLLFIPFCIVSSAVIFGHARVSKILGIKDFIANTETPSENAIVYAFQKIATIGIPREYDFALELIALLDPEGASNPVCKYANLVFEL